MAVFDRPGAKLETDAANAYAGFEEDVAGTLEEGRRADFVVLSDNPRAIDPVKIRGIRVLATVIDGEAVFRIGQEPSAE